MCYLVFVYCGMIIKQSIKTGCQKNVSGHENVKNGLKLSLTKKTKILCNYVPPEAWMMCSFHWISWRLKTKCQPFFFLLSPQFEKRRDRAACLASKTLSDICCLAFGFKSLYDPTKRTLICLTWKFQKGIINNYFAVFFTS